MPASRAPPPSVPKLTPKRVPSHPPPLASLLPRGRRDPRWGAHPRCSPPHVPQREGMPPSPLPAPLGGDTATAQGRDSLGNTVCRRTLPQPPCGPHRRAPLQPSRYWQRASEGAVAGRGRTPTCQHTQGPPVAPHGRGRVFRHGAAGRASDFLTARRWGSSPFKVHPFAPTSEGGTRTQRKGSEK